jgi:hypothetical protein
VTITTEEWRLLGLESGTLLPPGGQKLLVRIEAGNHSAEHWTALFGPIFRARYGVNLYPGSFNLRAEHPIVWDAPLSIPTTRVNGEFCPVILEEAAVGVAFRGNSDTPVFLEVLAPVKLRDRVTNADDGNQIAIRLLSGKYLRHAA